MNATLEAEFCRLIGDLFAEAARTSGEDSAHLDPPLEMLKLAYASYSDSLRARGLRVYDDSRDEDKNMQDPVMADLARELAERGKAEEDVIDRERFSDEELANLEAGEPPPDPKVDP